MMTLLRTPDERFQGLSDYAFEPHYITISDSDGSKIRVHYVDEGPREAPTILLMHGNPTWVYLYRFMIPGLVAAGNRVIAVDLVGCGRSDKPAKRSDYNQARHVEWMSRWLEAADLNDITLFCQDWGGTIGLHLVADYPDRFARVIASNTGLPTGQGNKALKLWQLIMRFFWAFPFKRAMGSALMRPLSDEEWAAYTAPFATLRQQAGVLTFPRLIGVTPDNPSAQGNRAALEKLGSFEKPFLTLFGGKDPMSKGAKARLQKTIPGSRGQAHKVYPEAGHFIQEEVPNELVADILAFMKV